MTSFSPLVFVIASAILVATTEGNIVREDLGEALRELDTVQEDFNYDTLILSEQWAPSTCQKGNPAHCAIPPNMPAEWSIHGLWPSKMTSNHPTQFCTNDPYVAATMGPIRGQMDLSWPNLRVGNPNDVFWGHEYRKHGTCASDIVAYNSQIKYFTETLTLYNQHNLRQILANAGIVPDDVATYPLANVQAALHGALGRHPGVYCHIRGGRNYLWEIRLCYDKNSHLVNCRGLRSGNCASLANPAILSYPTFPPRPAPPGYLSQCYTLFSNLCSYVWNILPGSPEE